MISTAVLPRENTTPGSFGNDCLQFERLRAGVLRPLRLDHASIRASEFRCNLIPDHPFLLTAIFRSLLGEALK
jgi:hypothetical protein